MSTTSSKTVSACHQAALHYHAAGYVVTICDGKRPRGKAWPQKRWTLQEINAVFHTYPDSSVGINLGASAIIDIEADSPEEEDDFRRLFEGVEIPQTLTFRSARGLHRLFRYSPRFDGLGIGVHYFGKLGIRIGGDGKGAHSCAPPSANTDGSLRAWVSGHSPGDCNPAELPAEVIDRILVDRTKPPATKQPSVERGNGAQVDESDAEQAREALRHVSASVADHYEEWLRIGMALHSIDSGLLPAWDEWSRQSEKYQEGACAEKWRSFTGGGVGPGTLFHHAREGGWRPTKIPGRKGGNRKDGKPQEDFFSNADVIEIEDKPQEGESKDGEEKTVRVPLTMDVILDDLKRRSGNWPRRVGQTLFYDSGGEISWLGNAPALFGYLNAKLGRVNWHTGVGYVGRAELFEHLRNTATQYDAIEHLPHYPAMAGHYYACQTREPGDGQALDGLLARYRPSTLVDGDLLKAAIVTLFWGGPGGARPAFVITSDAGRGAGKTKTAESIAYIAGGHLDIGAQEDIGKIKERFLTPAALSKRVAMLDNVKSHKFSSADLEGLITCRDISGRALYIGDSCRPNTITWLITLNGVSLSNDLAQRSVIIKVDKGKNDAGWYETTLDYIDQHRQAIIADCRAFLETETTQLTSYSRWASWDRDILSRLPEPEEARQVIIDRQSESDADQDEAEIIADYFAHRLDGLGYDSERELVRIPVNIVAQWYCNAIGERLSTTKVSRHLGQMVTEGKLPQLTKDAGRAHGRCYIWTGDYSDVISTPANDLTSRLRQYSQLAD